MHSINHVVKINCDLCSAVIEIIHESAAEAFIKARDIGWLLPAFCNKEYVELCPDCAVKNHANIAVPKTEWASSEFSENVSLAIKISEYYPVRVKSENGCIVSMGGVDRYTCFGDITFF